MSDKCKCGNELEHTGFYSEEEEAGLYHCNHCGRLRVGSRREYWVEHKNVHLIPKFNKQKKER